MLGAWMNRVKFFSGREADPEPPALVTGLKPVLFSQWHPMNKQSSDSRYTSTRQCWEEWRTPLADGESMF